MTNEEVTDFIKKLKEVSNQTTDVSNTKHAKFIGERNVLLRKAADLIESLQNTLITIDTQALECANLLEDRFKTQEEIERLKQQQDDYGEEIK
jgi:anion-transporting  ArsA/GET3 family ATPase